MSLTPQFLNVANKLVLEFERNKKRQVEQNQLLGLGTLAAALPVTAVYGLKAGLPVLAMSMYHLFLAKQKENMVSAIENFRLEHLAPKLTPSALPKPRPY